MSDKLIASLESTAAELDRWYYHGMAANVRKAIAALSAKPEPECICPQFACKVHTYQSIKEPAKPYSAQHMQMNYQMPDEPAKPMAERVTADDIQQLENLATRLEGYRGDNQQIREKLAGSVAERVEEWIAAEIVNNAIGGTILMGSVISESAVRTFLTTLTAEHEAQLAAQYNQLSSLHSELTSRLMDEIAQARRTSQFHKDNHLAAEAQLAAKEAETAEWKMAARAEARAHDECRAELAQAEAKGRREALSSVPVEALVSAVDALNEQTDRALATPWMDSGKLQAILSGNSDDIDAIKALIESARAAQEAPQS